MQIASASSSPPTSILSSPSAADPVAQMQQYASTLSDSSTASDEDKINAFVGISKMWGNVGGWYANSTSDQRNAVIDAYNNSSISKQIEAAANQFHDAAQTAVAKDEKTGNGSIPASDSPYARLNALSPLEQQLVFAGTATVTQYPTLDDWKAELKQEAARFPGFNDSSTASSAVTVSLSDAAKAALAGSSVAAANTSDTTSGATSDPATAAAQALKTLTSPSTTNTIADAALTILQNAAAAQATAKSDADKAEAANTISATPPGTTTQKTYTVGSKLDATV